MVPSEFKVNAGFETVVVKITSDGFNWLDYCAEPVVARPPVCIRLATIAFKTTIVAVAVVQLTGLLLLHIFDINTISAGNCVGL
jgi:hypothetical protein